MSKSYRALFLEQQKHREKQERRIKIALVLGALYFLGHIVWYVYNNVVI